MIEFIDVSYDDLMKIKSHEVFHLRKLTFSDRLQWDVKCFNNMEFDEFDNINTRYILGYHKNNLLCSVRFNPITKPNMIRDTFGYLFNDVSIPNEAIESSRFFVDKERARKLLGVNFPVGNFLFLSMIHFVRNIEGDGIYTIVSHAMTHILKRAGWDATIIKMAHLTPTERIYLLFLPTDKDSQLKVMGKIEEKLQPARVTISNWPLAVKRMD
ncbi:acyl-homoserine-lactone synthase [Izhakiella australiensis]|uniref:Acyl-homoserine-lactone synthase n=1 Tax=Izhakiella australiensis TaxID=1926881 RepID=A0A1S8YSC8_9GAMM|nr:acyl-homoserine-lactone synthase [Izhakiella australiensis]OON41775.1 acyl-homoserine-lactone synthase [Izhakiella australiensis]